jgi:transcriptional regulator GlxA family with amidase domain
VDDLIERLRKFCKGRSGRYEDRLMAGNAADELDRLRRDLAEAHQAYDKLSATCTERGRELAEARAMLRKTADDVDDIATDCDLCDAPMQLREVARDLRAFLTPSPLAASHDPD